MELTKEQKEQIEIKRYGCTLAEVKEEMEGRTKFNSQILMYAMAILSDAQHTMESDPETARQWINKAKYWIDQVQSKELQREIGQ